ncbi:hypothetical protein [Bacillus sp. V5-8f]|uniref:hypothetical protein n=1 Tax=Bacillus sp. V5-8f TaxID=2053044 RepID=UPI000C77F4DB|nr:hypothetical protein [Bacillus sp. V5-8f]PLT35606.1 hypothetical protein CUU64_03100 [Bacillus sp. V5-8f]
MSLEWFDRVCGELQDSLESICDKYDQNGEMSIERGAKHPRIEFYTEGEDVDREYFCTLFFDPHNEEFYIESFEPDLAQVSKVVLTDIEDIVDAVHERFHDYMNGDIMQEDLIDEDEDMDDGIYLDEEEIRDLDGRGEIQLLEEIDVDWETPEVTAYYQENDVEVTYQFGIVQETGDGVLKRVNRIWTDDEDMIKDETNFIFSKEEASTIIAMIASHMDSLTEMDYQGEV